MINNLFSKIVPFMR